MESMYMEVLVGEVKVVVVVVMLAVVTVMVVMVVLAVVTVVVEMHDHCYHGNELVVSSCLC